MKDILLLLAGAALTWITSFFQHRRDLSSRRLEQKLSRSDEPERLRRERVVNDLIEFLRITNSDAPSPSCQRLASLIISIQTHLRREKRLEGRINHDLNLIGLRLLDGASLKGEEFMAAHAELSELARLFALQAPIVSN